MTAFLRPERPYASRVEALHDWGALVQEGGPVTGPPPAYCPDPDGRDILATPEEIDQKRCAECKKHAIREARVQLDAGHEVDLVFSVSGSKTEHISIRVNGVPFDPAREAGMPPLAPNINRGAVIVPVRRGLPRRPRTTG